MPARILHVDVDAFFASVEQALNPALRGRPVVVGGDGETRTVVASCSYEARSLGVRNAMTTAEARRRCPDAVFLEGDSRTYRRAAEEVFRHLKGLSPRVQTASLDEAYVDLGSGAEGEALTRAEGLAREVRRDLGLHLSVGIGTNLLLARLATRFAKPRGVFQIRSGSEARFLHPLPVRHLPGIGSRTAEALERFQVPTVGALARVPRDVLIETFGKRGDRLADFARGHDPREVDPRQSIRSVSRETSFERPLTTHGPLFGMASYLLERAMKEVLAQHLRARTLAVKIRHVDGTLIERRRTLPLSTVHEANLIPLLDRILREIFVRRSAVQLVGVRLEGLDPDGERQAELFPDPHEERLDRLAGTLEAIRERHGFGAIVQGPAVALLKEVPLEAEGFRLRIPSLTR